MSLIKKLEKSLVKIGDSLEIHPMEGRKRTKKLNRTFLEIVIEKGVEEFYSSKSYRLRALRNCGTYHLNWCEEENNGYFKLESLSTKPFLLNGNLVQSCVLKRGDIVDLDYNRLTFLEKNNSKTPSFSFESWPKEAPIYLEGETGVGKSTMAKELHQHFVGENMPFVALNLSSFSESLLESELFGHEKGAFTGAVREKRGAVELAKGGTLFIDEIDSLPLHLQVKLLTFLDDQTFRRVGGETLKKVNCRLIFASGRCLRKLVKEKLFRVDLYFRILSGISHKILPLRQDPARLEEVLFGISREKNLTIDEDLKSFYMEQPWPGNIRQLRSHLLRKCLRAPGQKLLKLDKFDSQLLPINFFVDKSDEEEQPTLVEVKKNYCSQVLFKSQGSYEIASKKLGIAISTLRRVMAA